MKEIGFTLRRPCPHCPFRTDCMEGWLSRGRAAEIAKGITHDQGTFSCHETTTVGGAEPGKEQHCAGALLMLEKSGVGVGQYARISERLGVFEPDKLDQDAPVFESVSAFVAHHEGESEEPAECCSIADDGCEAPAGYAVGGGAVENFEVEPGVAKHCDCCGEPVCQSCSAEKDGRYLCTWCAQ